MVSSATTRNRLEKIGPGEQLNSWGGPNGLNRVIDLIDALSDGWVTISATATLTSSNYIADQARMRLIKYTGASTGTITVPSVEKWYWVRAVSADVILTTGGGNTATVKAGDFAAVACDGADCRKIQSNDFGGSEVVNIGTPMMNSSAVTKAYVDGIAFQTTGALPGQNVGTTYLSVFSDGAAAAWRRSLPASSTATLGQVLKSTGVDGYPEGTSQWAWDGWQGYQTKTATYTVALSDRGTIILASNTITLNLTAAATLGNRFYCRLINVGTGLVTIDPAGTETVTVAGGSAKTSITLIAGEGVDVFCDGSNWIAIVSQSAGAGPHLYAYEDAASSPSYSAATWQARLVSNIVDNVLGVTYSGGNLTNVPAGKYRAKFSITGVGVDVFVGRIYNNTAGAEIFHGEAGYATSFGGATAIGGYAAGDDTFTLSVTSSLALQSYATNNNGAGTWLYGGSSPVNKAAAIWLTRISP
jgi:hypothetical protein